MTRADNELRSSRSTATPGDLAFVAMMLHKLRVGDDLRCDKVRRIRTSIRANDYENSLKLDVAAERVVTELETARDGRTPLEDLAKKATPIDQRLL